MKIAPILFFLICICFRLTAQEDNSQSLLEDSLKKYPIYNAIIEYEVTGDATGSATRTFTKHGWQELFSSSITINKYGTTTVTDDVTTILGDYTYTIKNKRSKGTKNKDARMSELLSYKSARETIDAIMTSEGGTKAGQDTILNKNCVKWVFKSGVIKEIYEWEGIPLKIRKQLPGIAYEITATELNMEVPIDENLFSLPENTEW